MNPAVYAVIDHDGYITALVNTLLLPEIVEQANALPAPSPDPFPEPGKVWRRVEDSWNQVPEPWAGLNQPFHQTAINPQI